MSFAVCEKCLEYEARLFEARERVRALEVEVARMREQAHEVTKLSELQRADLDRYRESIAASQPNQRERVDVAQLQLAFERVIAEAHERTSDAPTIANPNIAAGAEGTAVGAAKTKQPKDPRPHSRRPLEFTNLPVQEVIIDPDDVRAAGGVGFELVSAEISDRLAFQRACYKRLRLVRRIWKRLEEANAASCESEQRSPRDVARLLTAELPESVWPDFMADPSVIAAHIVAKYDDCLPLYRQEAISARNGFAIPRSTQCGWLGAAHDNLYRITDAMFAEARAKAFCIALDSTSVPVLARGGCHDWHVFVFIADRDHVVFQFAAEQTKDVVSKMLTGYRGHVLADAAPVFDILYGDGSVLEVGCWFHLRRYFWRALETEKTRAVEALAMIAKLFTVARECASIPMPDRTAARASAARPVLDLFDRWIAHNRELVDPRGRLDKAIGYYENQRVALRRFLDDGRLRLDNSISEQQLRRTILGTHNWTFFCNRTGLRWYSVFRSLIASCALHGLNAQTYLEEVLRLAPHWPTTRMLELAPKYWSATRAKLGERHRAIIRPPWELNLHLDLSRAGPTRRVA